MAPRKNLISRENLGSVHINGRYITYFDGNKVGIVSTSATIQNKLYENAFEKAGIAYETPNDFQQAKMGKFILNLVTGQQKNSDREELIKIIIKLSSKYAKARRTLASLRYARVI